MTMLDTALSRRGVLAGLGGLTFCIALGNDGVRLMSQAQADALANANVTPWVRIAPDGKITILSAGAEMGQGSMTSLPLILAEEMDADWFEDPVWRKERLVGINLHFITAFLDRYVKGDASRGPYIDGLVVESSEGEWPTAPKDTPWGAYSPGGDGITLWKGFQRRHAEGLSLMHQDASR